MWVCRNAHPIRIPLADAKAGAGPMARRPPHGKLTPVRGQSSSVVVVLLAALAVVAVAVARAQGQDAQRAGEDRVVAGLDRHLDADILQVDQPTLHVGAVAAVVVVIAVVVASAAVVTVVTVVVAAAVVLAVPPVVAAVVTCKRKGADRQQASGTHGEDDSSLLKHGISP